MMAEKARSDVPSLGKANITSEPLAKQSFPPDGLVALSRVAYQSTPLAIDKLNPRVFVFRGAGGNVTAISGSDGAAVIDTGYGPRVDEIRSSVAWAIGRTPDWLVDTHWHFDHTDGNLAYAAAGVRVVAHSNCRERLSREQYVASLDWRIQAYPRLAWPTLTISGTSAIDLGQEMLQLLPQAAAHTDGDIAILLPSSNVLVMGDLFTNGSYPVIDESSGGTLRGMIDALERLMPLVDGETVIVPGHGLLGDRPALVRFVDMLHTIEDRVLSLIKARLPYYEIIASFPTADFDPYWGRGYVTGSHFLRMVLAGLKFSEGPTEER
jgi:cyclase